MVSLGICLNHMQSVSSFLVKLWKNPEQFLFIHDALRDNIYYLELDIDGLTGWLYEYFGFF